MKRRIGNLICLLGFSAVLAPAQLRAQQSGDPPADKYTNAIVAIVNDKVITLEQLRKEIKPLVQGVYDAADVKYPTDELAAKQEVSLQLQKLQKELVHSMVDRILVIQAFHDKGMGIPPAYLDRRFDDSITTRFKGDHEAYLRYLQANNMTERDYRKQLEEDSIVDYMRSQLRDSVTGISPDRIKDYYEKNQKQFSEDEAVQLRQITLKPQAADETPEQLLQQANLIEQQAKLPNADFAELARRSSQDEYAKAGGEVGWLPRHRLQQNLEDAAFALAPGQVSDPVAAGGNVYIFKCEDKRAEGVQPLEKVRAEIEALLVFKDERQAEEKWLQRLRQTAYIHFQDSFFNYD